VALLSSAWVVLASLLWVVLAFLLWVALASLLRVVPLGRKTPAPGIAQLDNSKLAKQLSFSLFVPPFAF